MELSNGEVLEEFEIDHRIEGFQEFFSRIEKHRKHRCANRGQLGVSGLDTFQKLLGHRLAGVIVNARRNFL